MEGQHNAHNGTQHALPRLCHHERLTRAQYILTRDPNNNLFTCYLHFRNWLKNDKNVKEVKQTPLVSPVKKSRQNQLLNQPLQEQTTSKPVS